jgi:hypothetical protein
MNKEEGDKRKRNYSLRRSIMDYGMGVFIVLIGVVIFLVPVLKLPFAMDNFERYMFSGLFVLYGAFRIYRGAQKNYFND